jgi:hypothetical protein
MKALLLLILGISLAAFCGFTLLGHEEIRGTLIGALHFIGLITGSCLALYGLIANHHDHTRRR